MFYIFRSLFHTSVFDISACNMIFTCIVVYWMCLLQLCSLDHVHSTVFLRLCVLSHVHLVVTSQSCGLRRVHSVVSALLCPFCNIISERFYFSHFAVLILEPIRFGFNLLSTHAIQLQLFSFFSFYWMFDRRANSRVLISLIASIRQLVSPRRPFTTFSRRASPSR